MRGLRNTLTRALSIGVFCCIAAAVTAAEPTGQSGWLGVMLGSADRPTTDSEVDARGGSVRVTGIVRDSPADRAGMRGGDRILTIDGRPIDSPGEVIAAITAYEPGSWIPFTVARGRAERDLRVRLDGRPDDLRKLDMIRGWIGVSAIDLPRALLGHFGAPDEAGAMISGIVPGSPAFVAGLELGDVVYEVDGEPVGSSRDLVRRIASCGVGNRVELAVARAGLPLLLEALVEDQARSAP